MSSPQLFCFTYAGGSASFFDRIEKDLPDLEIVKLEYAGHGTRHKEPFYRSFDELAADMFRQVKAQYAGGPFALFGYSMGTITLVEVLKRILDDPDMKEPCHVFLAAHKPYSQAEIAGLTQNEMQAWVKRRTIQLGALPEKLIENPSFWRMYLPLYCADYSMIGKYSFEELTLQTAIPAAVFYSETDTPRADMEHWKRYFTGDCAFYRYEGSHFFIQAHHVEMADVIKARLQGRKGNDL